MFGALTSLMRGQEAAPNPRVIGWTTWRRLVAFYLFVGGAVVGLGMSVPSDPTRDGRIMAPWLATMLGYLAEEAPTVPPWLDAALAMTTACILAIPLAFVYIRTRTRQKYDESLINSVIILPPLVSAILVVVQNSLALAFTLTGIVAAVRFRSNLKDSRDAVYILAAVGIGFASGVYFAGVALVVSLIFALLELLTWKANLARDHEHVMAVLFHSRVQPAGVESPAAGPAHNGHGSLERARLVPHEEHGVAAGTEKTVRDTTLHVVVSDIDDGRVVTEAVLTRMTKRWELRKASGGGHPQLTLDYRVRLRKRYPAEAVLEAIHREGAPFVRSAERAGG